MGHYDPDAPDVLGMEWPALYSRDVPLDAGIEYGQTFRSTVAESLGYAYTYFTVPPPSSYQFYLRADVYEKGKELATGPVQRTLVACNGGTLGGSGSLVGSGTIAAALASAADESYVLIGSGGTGFFAEFATAGMFTGKRILRLVLHHAIENVDPDAENPELGAVFSLDPLAVTLSIYGNLVCDRTARTTDLGEINPQPPSGTVNTNNEHLPWTVDDVQALDTGAYPFRFDAPDNASRHVHYAALEVVWCEENRVATGCRRFGSAGGAGHALAVPGFQNVPLRTPSGAAGWAKPGTGEFAVTVSLADTGGPYFPVAGLTDVESYGPVPSIALLDSFTVFAPHEGRAIPRGVDNEPKSADAVSALPGIALLDASFAPSPDPHSYHQQLVAPVWIGVTAIQEIQQQAVGSTSFPWVRFWARHQGSPSAGLSVTCDGRTATITPAELDALPEIIDGWRYVMLRFATPATMGTTGLRTVTFTSSAAIADRWEILGATYYGASSATGPTYGGTTAAATHDGARDNGSDLAVSLATPAPGVTGLSATPLRYSVPGLGLECGGVPDCIPIDIGYVDLTWSGVGTSVTGSPVTGAPVTGFGYYEVQRRDSDPQTMQYATIGTTTATRFPDFEAREGMVSTYRVRAVRDDGTTGEWSAPTSGTPPAPAGAAAGVLIFTSNVDPTRSLAYGEAFIGGSPSEDFTFVEAETRQLVRLYQQDYQRALRPTERGGVAFSRALLIGHTRSPSPVTPAVYGTAKYGSAVYGDAKTPSADHAFDRLRDLAWDPDLPYVCVKDDLGNRWLANVNVPSGNVRRSGAIFVAQVSITEVTATFAASDPAPVVPSVQYVFDGQSLLLAPTIETSWPARFMAAAHPYVPYSNVGVGGTTFAQRSLTAPVRVDPLFQQVQRSVYVVDGGQSDLGRPTYGTTAQLLADLTASNAARRAAGADYIVAVTIPPTEYLSPAGTGTVQSEANRVAFNAAIKANPAAYGIDRVIDVAAIPQLANFNDTTYFADGTHYTAAGAQVAANAVAAAGV